MKSTLILLGLFAISFQSSATIVKVGHIDCSTLERPDFHYVDADLYGTKTKNGAKVDHAHITFSKYEEATKLDTVIAQWKLVLPAKSGWMSMAFANESMRLEAWFDDVGAMSSITVDKTEHQLACDYTWER